MEDIANKVAELVVEDMKYFTAIVGFIGVIIGAVISIIGNLILHRLNAEKERRQEVLKRELDRLYQLEEMAGEITEWASSWQLGQKSPELRVRFHLFMISAGTFRKYPKLKQAIRDLNQQAMILTSDKISGKTNHNDVIDESGKLEDRYKVFITEYTAVIDEIKA